MHASSYHIEYICNSDIAAIQSKHMCEYAINIGRYKIHQARIKLRNKG